MTTLIDKNKVLNTTSEEEVLRCQKEFEEKVLENYKLFFDSEPKDRHEFRAKLQRWIKQNSGEKHNHSIALEIDL